jgi:hypothetical protein
MADVAPLGVNDILDRRSKANSYWHEAVSRYDTLLTAYHGNYQQLWPGEFRRGESPKVANWIRLGWKRYASMVGKVPSSHVRPSRVKRVSQSKADKIEKVLAHYDESSGMTAVMKQYAWYLVGFGSGVVGVVPDRGLQGPRYVHKDPRSVFPAPGVGSVTTSTSGYSMLMKPTMDIASMPWVIFDEVLTASAVVDTYPDLVPIFSDVVDHWEDPFQPVSVLTYMDKNYWQVVINDKLVATVDHGMGFVPFKYTTMAVPDQLGGESMFEQNIGLVLAYMRLLNQKLTYNENIVWPWLVTKGVNNMDPANRVIEIMDRDGDASFLNPPGEIQAERDLEVLDRLIRILNQDTESLRGEAPGSTVTGLGIGELNRTVTAAVQDFWDRMTPDIEFIRSAALIMDESLYGNIKKPMSGRAKGETFEDEYVPRKVIDGHHTVSADFGIGVGGFEGFVELMQFAAQGYIDEQEVMEQAPWIKSVSETKRRVLLDRIEKVIFEGTAGGMPVPLVNHLISWHQAIQDSKKDPYKWLKENPMPSPEPELGPGLGETPPGTPEGLPAGEGAAPPQVPVPTPSQIMALAQGRQ